MTTAVVDSPRYEGALARSFFDTGVVERHAPPPDENVRPGRQSSYLISPWVPDPSGGPGLICIWVPSPTGAA